MRQRCAGVVLVGAMVFGLATALAAGPAALEVDVQVAPHTLLLSSYQGGEVTVHAAIAYGEVDTESVTLNGIAVSWTKADCRGELVAKFDEEAVKAIVDAPSATLTLSGMTLDGEIFSGSDTVKVKR